MIKRKLDEEHKIITAEVVTVSHIVYCHQSFSSNDSLNVLLPAGFSNSKTGSKMSNARTKPTAIIKNVITLFTIAVIIKALNASSFYGCK